MLPAHRNKLLSWNTTGHKCAIASCCRGLLYFWLVDAHGGPQFGKGGTTDHTRLWLCRRVPAKWVLEGDSSTWWTIWYSGWAFFDSLGGGLIAYEGLVRTYFHELTGRNCCVLHIIGGRVRLSGQLQSCLVDWNSDRGPRKHCSLIICSP